MLTTIEVTEGDIRRGKPRDTKKCAVALALKRVCKPKVGVDVDASDITLTLGEDDIYLINTSNINAQIVFTPAKVNKFINKFDADKKSCRPFTFRLPIPAEYLRKSKVAV